MVNIKAYTSTDFIKEYLPAQKPLRALRATILHHTYRPRAEDFKGMSTIEGIRTFHTKDRGWSDIGANAYAAPNGMVYNARPLSADNYAHANVSRPWDKVPADVRSLAYPDRSFFNTYAFGIETFGNFDEDAIKPMPVALDIAFQVLAAVHILWDLPASRLFLHRDVAEKSCPGWHISREWARTELKRRIEQNATHCPQLTVTAEPANQPVDCNAQLEDGACRCNLRPLAEALGYSVDATHIKDTGQIRLHRTDMD